MLILPCGTKTRFRQVRDKHNFKKEALFPSKSEASTPKKKAGVKKATGRIGSRGKKTVEAPTSPFGDDDGAQHENVSVKHENSGEFKKEDSDDSQHEKDGF